jgi:methionine aminotransferase
LPAFYQAKRDYFLDVVRETPLQWLPCPSTYFVSARYGHLPAFAHMDEASFARHLTTTIGVACIPISAFYHDATDQRVVRFCFAKKEETLARAAERLRRLIVA